MSTTFTVVLATAAVAIVALITLIGRLLAKGFAQQCAQIYRQRWNRRKIRALADQIKRTPVQTPRRSPVDPAGWHDAVTATTRQLQQRRQ